MRFIVSMALISGLLRLAGPAMAADLLPNLKGLPATDISVGRNFAGDLEIRFAASSWNAGSGPLELLAGEVVRKRQNVYQRIYADDGGFRDVLAGSFEWHPTHNHFHFDDYALYTLQPTWTKSSRTATKTSFCIMDTDLIDGSLPNALGSSVYTTCGNMVQGMSVGWGDTYGSHLPGQEISLEKLKDGDYRLYIEADPKNLLLESDESDNVACVLLRISVTEETVEVLDPDGCATGGGTTDPGGAVTVTGIAPDFAVVGSPVLVTISGTGFVPGLDVTFENGSGPRPSAGPATFVDANTMTATVTVKNRGGRNPDYIWDVRVGNGVLVDAFTVVP